MAEPVSTTVLVAKVATALLSNDKTRKGIGWILVAIFSPLIVVVALICVILTGGASHNASAVDLAFNHAPIGNMPTEFRQSIENMRTAFDSLESEIASIETEDGSLDEIRIKAIFYAIFYNETAPQSLNHFDFMSCFYYTEERTREVTTTDANGNTITKTETYTVNIMRSDLLVVYQNISEKFRKEVTNEDMINANEIYIRQKYGSVTEIPSDIPFVGINGFVEPVANWITSVSSEYGPRIHPIHHTQSMHYGIDLAKPQGTPIHSVLDGTVAVVGYDADGYGYYIKINHGDGFETLYAHCSKTLVTQGQTVTAGEKIALVGTTGGSTGNHLHFETIVNGEKVNPRAYLPIE